MAHSHALANRFLALATAGVLAACAGVESSDSADAATDSAIDTAIDTASDTAIDSAIDVAVDETTTTAPDTGHVDSAYAPDVVGDFDACRPDAEMCLTPCPSSEPSSGTCNWPGACTYANKCGGEDTIACSTLGIRSWYCLAQTCTTFPPCPASKPPPGTGCSFGRQDCEYPNACGGTDHIHCPECGGAWEDDGSTCSASDGGVGDVGPD